MKRALLLAPFGLALLLLWLALPTSAAAQTSPPPMPTPVVVIVPVGTTYTGRLATFTADIYVVGTVHGDVTSVSGSIVVSGTVTGDVVSYQGQVVLAEQARIDGHVLVLSNTTQQAQGAYVAGRVIGTVRPPEPAPTGEGVSHAVAAELLPDTLWRGAVTVLLVLLVVLVALLALTLLHHRTARSAQVLLRLPRYTLVLGLVSSLLLSGGLSLLVIALAFTLIGIPLALVLLSVVHLPLLVGLVVGARALALHLRGTRGWQAPLTLLFSVGLLLPPLVLGSLAPLWGGVLLYLLASAGVGAVVLSRGGLLMPLAVRPIPRPRPS
ncbi:MAG: polymer-forming cytoskeletal protein [Chloroflexaceae bacterium]|nr:polymer-forming cytoskeletal protein [Chloroflexaceae bacterium]